jgi:FtsZ-interacting cell division protein ZipA
MLSNLEILLIAGAILVFLITLYLFYRSHFSRKLVESNIADSRSMLFDEKVEQGSLSFESDLKTPLGQELVILNLISMDKSNFDTNQVLTLLKNLGTKYSDGFFSYRDATGTELFRVASGINPGVLELNTETHILLMAVDLYMVPNPLKAFEQMLDFAVEIAEKLHASICDEARAP